MAEDNQLTQSGFWVNIFKSKTDKNDLLNLLNKIPPFNELKSSSLKEILKIVNQRIYQKGEYIFLQNDPGIGLYIIIEGKVTIEYIAQNGDKIFLASFSEGDFFGELALLDGEKRSASSVAKTESKLAVIFKPDLDEYVNKFPKEGIKIVTGFSKIIASRLRHLNNEYLELINKNLKSKETQNESDNKKNNSSS